MVDKKSSPGGGQSPQFDEWYFVYGGERWEDLEHWIKMYGGTLYVDETLEQAIERATEFDAHTLVTVVK